MTMRMKSFLRKIPVLLLGAAGLTAFTSCNNKYRVWVGHNGDQKIYNLPYGEDPKQVMDVFLPKNAPSESPVVMIVHGGAWKYGRKEHMIMIQKYLHEHQVPTVNIDYRHASRKKQITYREQLQDLDLARQKFNTLAPKTGLLPDHYILLGESAGAHLALLYGYQHPEYVKRLISMSGPVDFHSSTYLSSAHSWYSAPTLQTVVGEKFNRKNLSEKFREASPVNYVSHVPTLIFQGDSDYLVNRNQALKLDSVLKAKKVPHQLVYMKNTGHTPRFFSKHKRDKIIFPAILNWVKK